MNNCSEMSGYLDEVTGKRIKGSGYGTSGYKGSKTMMPGSRGTDSPLDFGKDGKNRGGNYGEKGKERGKVAFDPTANPIIQAIYKVTNGGPKAKLSKEHFYKMDPQKIFTLLDNLIQDRVYMDLETATGPVSERVIVPFANFLYDQVLMNFGLVSLAIRTLMQMVNGLKTFSSKTPFGYHQAQICGLAQPVLRYDEIEIALRCHVFFKMV